MKISWNVSFFAIILYALGLVCSGQDDCESSKWVQKHCRDDKKRVIGDCRRRLYCLNATRNGLCQGENTTDLFNPVVCCLTGPHYHPWQKKNLMPRAVGNMDLTFPGCGMRSPKVQENTWPKPPNRRGRRSQIEGFPYSRTARELLRPLIVGGITAKAHSWPWMVALFVETNPRIQKRFRCGASLISKKYVLCAAHCFNREMKYGDIDASTFFVMVGSHEARDGTEYPVESVSVHPGFRRGDLYNDISLLRIQGEVQLTEKVYPVCLPSDGLRDKVDPGNNMVTVTGWGNTETGGTNSKVLQEVTVPIVPNKECNATYSTLLLPPHFPKEITNVFICAGLKEGGKDACQDDSGGPLVSKLKDGSYVQLGIVSFGYGCALPGYPGVYTRVSQYTKWLSENTDLGRA